MMITVKKLLDLNPYVQDVEIRDYETEHLIVRGESCSACKAFSQDILNARVEGFYAEADDCYACVVILIQKD